MKKIYVLLWIVFGGLMLLSCFKDKGNYDYSPINRFEVTMTPEVTSDNQIYYVVRPSTGDDSVTFSVSITQTLALDSTNLDLTWSIWEDGATVADTFVGYSHTFYFPKGADKTYEVAFLVRDMETGIDYLDEFTVRTRDAFNYSWIVVNGDEGDRKLGFLDFPASNGYTDSATVVPDGYAILANGRRFEDLQHVAFLVGVGRTSEGRGDRLLLLSQDSAWVLLPYSMEVRRIQQEVYYQGTPVAYAYMQSSAGQGSDERSVLISESGQYYVSDYWGYIYNVPLGEGVPSNYTATKAYAVSMDNNNSMSSGPNLVWDGENHLFYYYLSVPQSANRSDSRYTNGDEYRLEGMEAHGDFPAAVNLDDLELLWLGKGMRDFETRSTTATAVMRSSEGDLRFIHFAFGSGDGYDDVVIESEPAEFGQYTVDENSKFATTVAFPNQIFFTDNSGGIYCLYNASDNKEVVQVANIGLGNEIVDMQFRIPVNSQNGLPSSVEGEEFTRFLAIAYNMPDGTGCVLELKFATSGAVERQTLYTGFERISQIEYMPRMTKVGF